MAFIDKTPYHFYLPDGTSQHGTIEEGIKTGAYPSVTTALSIIRKEFVELWKIREGIAASKLLPQNKNESDKDFANRCIAHSERMQGLTTGFGTQIHKSIEEFHLLHMAWKKGETPYKPTADASCISREDTIPWTQHYITWFHKHVDHVIAPESTSVSNAQQYAGQIDAIVHLHNGKLAILDFKTQKLKEKLPWGKIPRKTPQIALPHSNTNHEKIEFWPASFYETWEMQLCAYRASLHEQTGKLADHIVSVVINSQEPTPIQDKFWNPKGYDLTYQAFLNALNLWKWINNYQLPKAVLSNL